MKIKRCFRDKHHPLILREKKMNENENENEQAEIIICRICTRTISEASFYACDECEYYLHNSCTELPHEINNSLHHPHPLKLDEQGYGRCNNCEDYFRDAPLYHCPDRGCLFEMDVECALMPTRSTPCGEGEAQRSILHFSHNHSLLLVDLHTDDNYVKMIKCYGCRSTCSGLAYGCTKCNIFLHKSCAELPRKIQHPLHLGHGFLSLRFGITYDGDCFLCERSNPHYKRAFFLQCCEFRCSFRLCWSCSQKKRRAIMYEGHDHNLHFVEKNIETEIAMCNGYNGYCAQPIPANSSELSHTKSNIFVCMDCDFKVHMLCGPLPATIKHEYHIHRLTLADFVEEDYDEYYCDVCETKRDPRIRLYYCAECKYFAHVHCLFSEIAKALIEEDHLREDDVELMIMGQYIWDLPSNSKLKNNENKLGLTLADVLNKVLSEKERSDLSKSKSDTLRNPTPPQSELMSTQEVDEILKLIRFTDSDFESFFKSYVENFDDNKLPFKSGDLELKTVDVEGYMVPHTVGRIMRALLHRYGDLSSDSTSDSREEKSIVYFLLCEALRRMATTLVVDITKGDLQEWYHHLCIAKGNGFKVDFACAHLEKLVRAFLGLQADKLKDQLPARLRQDVAILEQEIAERKSKLEMCESYSGPSPKSQFMIDCVKEGSDMKRKIAWDQHLFSHCSPSKPTAQFWSVVGPTTDPTQTTDPNGVVSSSETSESNDTSDVPQKTPTN